MSITVDLVSRTKTLDSSPPTYTESIEFEVLASPSHHVAFERVVEIVQHIVEENKLGQYVLIPFSNYNSGMKRADVYKNFHILHLFGTKTEVGWLVRNYLMKGTCKIRNGTKKYNSRQGTSQLRRHVEIYSESPAMDLVTAPLDVKRPLCEAAAEIWAVLNYPFSFCANKSSLQRSCRLLVETG